MRRLIPENLATVYELTVPFVFDMRKFRKQLDAELEKRHPCFLDRCVADYRLRFLPYGKRSAGFHVRAVVMDRLQLAALRKTNAGRTLYLGGNRPYAVFSREIQRKRLLLAVVLFCALSLTLLTVRFFELHPSAVETAEVSSVPEADEPPVISPVLEQPDFSTFIRVIHEQKGRLSLCSWYADSGLLVIKTEGLFPEQLEAAAGEGASVNFGAVSYRGEIPEVEVTLAVARQNYPAYPEAAAYPEISGIRSLFFENGGALLSETVSPLSFSGLVPESAWAAFSPVLTETLSETAVNILKLSRENGNISVFLQFAASGLADLPLSDVSCVFGDAPGLPFEKEVLEDERQVAFMNENEIGRITRNDGSSVVFFHNEEGKIERRIYEN